MNKRPLVLEFTGLPNSGKTTLIHTIAEKLQKDGYKVKIMQEDAELVPKCIPKKTWVRNVWIAFGQFQSLLEIPYLDVDIVFLDRGFYDALFWADFLLKQNVCSKAESDSLKRFINDLDKNFGIRPDYLFVIDVSVEESLKRRYALGGNIVLSNDEFLTFYKRELEAFNNNVKTPIFYLDTTTLTKCASAFQVYEKIMELIK